MKKVEIIIRTTTGNTQPIEKVVAELTTSNHKIEIEQNVLSYPGLEIHLEHRRVFKDGQEIHLSRYEYGVLSFMAQHPGQLFTKEQIFEAVWHQDTAKPCGSLWTHGRAKPDSLRASVLKGMMHFVELYRDEYDEGRLLRALRGIHPIEVYRIGRDNPEKLPGWKKYVYPIYTAYNGKCRTDALPMKFWQLQTFPLHSKGRPHSADAPCYILKLNI